MTDGLQLRARPDGAGQEARCPYCRDSLGEDPAATCPGCRTPHHVECLIELEGRCSTTGCGQAVPLERLPLGLASGTCRACDCWWSWPERASVCPGCLASTHERCLGQAPGRCEAPGCAGRALVAPHELARAHREARALRRQQEEAERRRQAEEERATAAAARPLATEDGWWTRWMNDDELFVQRVSECFLVGLVGGTVGAICLLRGAHLVGLAVLTATAALIRAVWRRPRKDR